MPLPTALTARVEEAYHALFRHPERELLPWYRYAIYTALALGDPPSSSRMRAWLDILAVWHVLFCWQPEAYGDWPSDWLRPKQLLALAEQLLASIADKANAAALINRAQAVADIVGADPTARHYPSWCVYEAAMRALDSTWSVAQRPTIDAPPALRNCLDDASHYAAIAVAAKELFRQGGNDTGIKLIALEDLQLHRSSYTYAAEPSAGAEARPC